MSEELIKRLREDWPEILVEKHWMMDSDAVEDQRKESADRIEEMAARYDKSQDQIDRLIAENQRLREELRQIYVDATEQHADWCNIGPVEDEGRDWAFEISMIARAALETHDDRG